MKKADKFVIAGVAGVAILILFWPRSGSATVVEEPSGTPSTFPGSNFNPFNLEIPTRQPFTFVFPDQLNNGDFGANFPTYGEPDYDPRLDVMWPCPKDCNGGCQGC